MARIEYRKFLDKAEKVREFAIVIADSQQESLILDTVFGSRVGEDGAISPVVGTLRLSEGGAHYLSLEKPEEG